MSETPLDALLSDMLENARQLDSPAVPLPVITPAPPPAAVPVSLPPADDTEHLGISENERLRQQLSAALELLRQLLAARCVKRETSYRILVIPEIVIKRAKNIAFMEDPCKSIE